MHSCIALPDQKLLEDLRVSCNRADERERYYDVFQNTYQFSMRLSSLVPRKLTFVEQAIWHFESQISGTYDQNFAREDHILTPEFSNISLNGLMGLLSQLFGLLLCSFGHFNAHICDDDTNPPETGSVHFEAKFCT